MFLCWRGSQNVRAKTFMEREVAERYEEPALSAFGAGLKQMFLRGGQVLLRENEVADSLYIAIVDVLASLYGTAMTALVWSRESALAKQMFTSTAAS
jgi:hypothetical protein